MWYIWVVTYLRRNVTMVHGASYHLLGSCICFEIQRSGLISSWSMIGHLFIFKKWTTKENILKITTPQKIYDFFSMEGKHEAVIQCSVKPLLWSTMERIFFKMKLGTDFKIHMLGYQLRLLYTHYVWFQIAVVTVTSMLFFYQNATGANSLGKELSSLHLLKYCKCVRENRNIQGHQQCTIASDWGFG